MEHSDENLNLRVSSKLAADLNVLFKPSHPVPPEVDRAVSDRICRHFVVPKPAEDKRRRFRWAALWKVAAAAAVVIFAFSLDLTQKPKPTTERLVSTGVQAADIDLNGRVDILDAFKLARQIKDAGQTKQDLSGLDMNGDGLVDDSDVDMVALAAVRLDKGAS
jgi:anti-sigma-K factor RskA